MPAKINATPPKTSALSMPLTNASELASRIASITDWPFGNCLPASGPLRKPSLSITWPASLAPRATQSVAAIDGLSPLARRLD